MSEKNASENGVEKRYEMNSFPHRITDHLILDTNGKKGASISIKPVHHATDKRESSGLRYAYNLEGHAQNGTHGAIQFDYMNENREADQLDSETIPQMNAPYFHGMNTVVETERVPLPVESKGFVHISNREDKRWKEKLMDNYNAEMEKNENTMEDLTLNQINAPYTEYVTEDAFQKIHSEFKGENGKFLAMTAYGAVPLPEEMMKKIPEKFVIKPIIEEREVFVNKQEAITRVSEKEFTQYTHKFSDIDKIIYVDKIKPIDDVTIVEVPFFKYKPIVEEKIVEVPCGIKYVEVPIEIPCRIPPRIVPVGKEHFVERIIEASKPVVQEKIVEVQEVVHKKVPKVVIKEIPYIVPRYVEKIIEVPYKLENQLQNVQGVQMTRIPTPPPLPIPIPENFKSQFANDYYQTTEKPLDDKIETPYGTVENNTFIPNSTYDNSKSSLPKTFYLPQHIKHIKLPYEAEINVSVVENSEIPADAPIINVDRQNSCRYDASPMHGMIGEGTEETNHKELLPSALNPVIEHTNPQMRAVEFRMKQSEPEVLTQGGVVGYSSFENSIK
ncbi:uncharacterized protein LOC128882893 [Hylaeus volcanicus]|uniref:uncharacterized protein LOC128882893 n=1 Tax=Hylaeus volcanicus TaxID=313075 RepID=UPI0023B80D4C|nr:uncharacterized protein LOC128882893 [Hylaeus volcanicus]XP_053990693.1 uncharacterized protein LOC128882893 [Hylaeus volcanicus]